MLYLKPEVPRLGQEEHASSHIIESARERIKNDMESLLRVAEGGGKGALKRILQQIGFDEADGVKSRMGAFFRRLCRLKEDTARRKKTKRSLQHQLAQAVVEADAVTCQQNMALLDTIHGCVVKDEQKANEMKKDLTAQVQGHKKVRESLLIEIADLKKKIAQMEKAAAIERRASTGLKAKNTDLKEQLDAERLAAKKASPLIDAAKKLLDEEEQKDEKGDGDFILALPLPEQIREMSVDKYLAMALQLHAAAPMVVAHGSNLQIGHLFTGDKSLPGVYRGHRRRLEYMVSKIELGDETPSRGHIDAKNIRKKALALIDEINGRKSGKVSRITNLYM